MAESAEKPAEAEEKRPRSHKKAPAHNVTVTIPAGSTAITLSQDDGHAAFTYAGVRVTKDAPTVLPSEVAKSLLRAASGSVKLISVEGH